MIRKLIQIHTSESKGRETFWGNPYTSECANARKKCVLIKAKPQQFVPLLLGPQALLARSFQRWGIGCAGPTTSCRPLALLSLAAWPPKKPLDRLGNSTLSSNYSMLADLQCFFWSHLQFLLWKRKAPPRTGSGGRTCKRERR